MNEVQITVRVAYDSDYEPVDVEALTEAAEKAIHEAIRAGGRGHCIELESEEVEIR